MNFEVHLLGAWLVLMILHGLIVDTFGEAFKHFPLYVGLLAAIVIMVRRKWSPLPIGISMVFFLLVVFMMLSGLTGVDPVNSIDTIILYIKGLLLAILIGGVLKNSEQIKTITLYCLFGILYGVYEAFRQHITGDYQIEGLYLQRVAGLTSDPNGTAMLLLAGVPISIYWLTHSKIMYRKIFFIVCLSSIVGAIALTHSRGGSVSLLIVMGIIYIKRPTPKGAIIGALILILGLLAAPTTYWDRMGTLVTGEKQGRSLHHRSNFVLKGLQVFSDHPILGVGPGNYGISINRLQAKSIIRVFDRPHVAHNMYLQYFVENGVLGGILFLMMLSYPLFALLKFDKENDGESSVYGLGFCMAVSLFGMLFAGLFLSQANNSVLWFFIGIGVAASSIGMKNSLKKREYDTDFEQNNNEKNAINLPYS